MKKTAIDFLASGRPWAITADAFATIQEIAERQNDVEAVVARLGRPLDNTRSVMMRGNTAILPIFGPIFPHANMFTEISGATSIDMLALDLQRAADDSLVKSVILDIHSPGGNVTGINEFAGMVENFPKPIAAFVGGQAASAAYWIASAADEIVIDATAMLGSIGVVLGMMREKDGDRIEIVSSQSPDKRIDPMTEEGRAVIQANVDDIAQVFVDAVARNRGMTADQITSGRGRMFVGRRAVEFGLADRMGSMESLVSEMMEMPMPMRKKPKHRSMPMMSTQETTAPGGQKPAITAESLKSDYPLVWSEIFSAGFDAGMIDGAKNERDRIKSVEAQMIPGHESLIQRLKFDGKTTGAEAAVQIIAAVKAEGSDMLARIRADAPPVLPASPEPESGASGLAGLPIEERCAAEWGQSESIRAEFGTLNAYIGYSRVAEKHKSAAAAR